MKIQGITAAVFGIGLASLVSLSLAPRAQAVVMIKARPDGDAIALIIPVINNTADLIVGGTYNVGPTGLTYAGSSLFTSSGDASQTVAAHSTGTVDVDFFVPAANEDASGNVISLNYTPGTYSFSIFGQGNGSGVPAGSGPGASPFTFSDTTFMVNIQPVPQPPGGCGSSTSPDNGCAQVYTFDHTVTIGGTATSPEPGSFLEAGAIFPLSGLLLLARRRRGNR